MDKSRTVFANVGERCNISGSIQFKKLILAGKFQDAMAVARKQVEDGAMIVDVNMDEGLLDGKVRDGECAWLSFASRHVRFVFCTTATCHVLIGDISIAMHHIMTIYSVFLSIPPATPGTLIPPPPHSPRRP